MKKSFSSKTLSSNSPSTSKFNLTIQSSENQSNLKAMMTPNFGIKIRLYKNNLN